MDDVLAEPNHIACDSNSRSEIVLPLFIDGQLGAVLDVDSDLPNAFDQVDQDWLEKILSVIGSGLKNRRLEGVLCLG